VRALPLTQGVPRSRARKRGIALALALAAAALPIDAARAQQAEAPIIADNGWPVGWYPAAETPPEPRLQRAGGYVDLEELPVPTWWDTAEPGRILSIALIRLYQTRISPHRSASCPMVPSCSRYGLQAISEYGWIQGWLMTIDRLFFRENPNMLGHYPTTHLHGVMMPYDPPAHDDLLAAPPWPLVPSDVGPKLVLTTRKER
jgi:putative component of membrane protein insertase Oxa1/YidC/SpoIIIJ protein YidD